MTEFMGNPFLIMALLAGIAASFSGGIVGSYIVVKRIVFLAGSIAHSVLGGMGLFLYLSKTFDIAWLSPIHGAFVAAIISAFLIGWIHIHFRQREDTVIAAIWALGMALGVIFISITPGYNVELMHFLFGNLLWTSHADIYTLFGLGGVILIISIFFHRRFLAISFDERQASLQGLPVKALYFLLLSLVAITVVLLIQVVGAILVIAILSLPPAIANSYTNRLSIMIILAVILSVIFTFIGIFVSFTLNWPPGASIAFTSTICYLLNLLVRQKA